MPKFKRMPVRFSLKSSSLVFVLSLTCAAGTAFLACFLLAGPKLGPHYDLLLARYKQPSVSREILIINTGEFTESGDIFSVLMTLTETDAAYLIFAGRASPSASPIIITEAEIRRRFIDEYSLLGSNIRNLFEAIRSGSVTSAQAPSYVNRLVELTEQGRDRLLTALVDKDEDLFRAASVFVNYSEVDAKPQADRDGKIRRVQPVNMETSVEHPVFVSLKNRYSAVQIETTEKTNVLWFRKADGSEFDIPLDKGGNIITPWNCNFRTVDITLFREYDEREREMRKILLQAAELGALSKTLPEQSPLITGDYALMLKEEMLKSPDSEKRAQWINMRSNYFKRLDEFLSGQAQSILIRGYDEVIASETSLKEEGIAALTKMRDELSGYFDVMRNEYSALTAVRSKLEEETSASFCILGNEANAQYQAMLANAIITGSHVYPVNDNYTLLFSTAAACVVLLAVIMMQPFAVLIFGSFFSILMGAAAGCVFVFYSFWIDPLFVISSSFTGILCIFFCKRAILKYRARRFRFAYGTAVSKDILKKLICSGKPRLSDVVIVPSAVIAIKDINLLKLEDREKPHNAGAVKKIFFSTVKDTVSSAGAIIAGYEGDTVLVCFGSPLDNTVNYVYRACSFVKELLGNEKVTWRFGIDAGDCTYYWSPEAGYSVNGRPAVRSKILVSKTARLQVRALITDYIRERTNADAKKIGSLFDDSEPIFDFSSSAISKGGFSAKL